MGQFIKAFSDSSYIEYDRGTFDDWCVFYVNRNGHRRPPRDVEYFNKLVELSQKYGSERVYYDFTKVYMWTDKNLSQSTLKFITELSEEYGEDSLLVDIIFSILYVAMIAEEQKTNTRLGKRIKRLGIHVLLLENETVGYAANFMKGKGWRDIDRDCRRRGF